MRKGIRKDVRDEVIEALRMRYHGASRADKGRLLDQLVAITGCHRKHAVRLLGATSGSSSPGPATSSRVYDEAVKQALIVAWEAADRICGKRLKAVLPVFVDAMERHSHLALDESVRARLLSMSPATMDRMLAPVRQAAGRRRKKRSAPTKAGKQIPKRTFSEWDEPCPGDLEIDFVVHCGGRLSGSYIHSLVATDVCSGWTEAVPLLAREQSLTVAGLDVIRKRMPIRVTAINSDNDSAFINDTLVQYCNDTELNFTRSRPYHKNDQAWIEQKNGAVIRRFVGYDRYVGAVAGQTLAQLYAAVRLYVNYFQPSFKLLNKKRYGAKVVKTYDKATTPCDRLLNHKAVDARTKDTLRKRRARLDPVTLLQRIRKAEEALVALSSGHEIRSADVATLDEFLEQLPRQWQKGEARPTHRTLPATTRYWRTRVDPFEDVWPEVLLELQRHPDTTAKVLFASLQSKHPGRFADGQLRTLQRRLKDWRQVMARKLVFDCIEQSEEPEHCVIG
jgi:hypothetical protein